MNKRKILFVLSLLPFVSLFGCSDGNSSSDQIDDGIFVITPNTYKNGSFRLELANTVLREGTTFYDGTNPVLYMNGRKYSKKMTYTIKSGKSTYDAGAKLSAGSYTFELKAADMNTNESLKGDFIVKKSQTIEGSEGNGYHTLSDEEVKKTSIKNFDNIGSLGKGKTASIGSPNLLVIPLTFLDTETQYTKKELSKIEKAYFGEADETSWESLTSYYKKSSYGKLNFQGKVVEPYQYNMSCINVENEYLNGSLNVNSIASSVVNSIIKRDNLNPSDYDTDGDGYMDGIEIIYKTTRDMTSATQNLWWCFTTTMDVNPDIENPKMNRYFWSLYSQIETAYYQDSIDAHTLVHETGHMLGLNDYYDYDGNSTPAGCADMMDRNIGDHTAYSKYLLGWVTPKVIDGTSSDFKITLSSFTDTGDCIILRNTNTDPFNGTPYDEYLMLSYITPTGVNKQDSEGYGEYNYSGFGNRGYYSRSGLQVMHIDNRMISFEGSVVNEEGEIDHSSVSYTDTLSNEERIETIDGESILTSSPSFTLTSNTASYSYYVNNGTLLGNSKYREITAIPASKSQTFQGKNGLSEMGVQTVLFGTSAYGCGSSCYSNYAYQKLFPNGLTWNDDSINNYVFEVLSQSDSSITIRFIKNF